MLQSWRCTLLLVHTPVLRCVLRRSTRRVPHRGECRTPAQLSGDVLQSLLAASSNTRCLAKHLLCGVLVSGEAYLVELTEVNHLLMTRLPIVSLLAKLPLRVFILFEVRFARAPTISWCRTTCSLIVNGSVLSCFRDRRPFWCLISIVSCHRLGTLV